jgi:soluble lytic murein transglycosylase-like protein
MDALRPTVAILLLLTPIETHAQIVGDQIMIWRPFVAEASARFGIPIDWIDRVIRSESGGHTLIDGRPIRSKAGAIGLMQLMPMTWTAMRDAYRLGPNPDDPHDNIIAGTAYLRMMADRFGYPGMFAAYNAGPERYAAYLAGRSPLPKETIAYLGGITGKRSITAVTDATPPHQLLFALRRDLDTGAIPAADRPVVDGLFAIRKGLP